MGEGKKTSDLRDRFTMYKSCQSLPWKSAQFCAGNLDHKVNKEREWGTANQGIGIG